MKAAQGFAAAIAAPDDAFNAGVFAPNLDRARVTTILRQLALRHGTCAVERGGLQVVRTPLWTNYVARYSLRCSEAPLALDFGIDEKTGQMTNFVAHAPRPSAATCWH